MNARNATEARATPAPRTTASAGSAGELGGGELGWLWWRTSGRHLYRQPWQTLALILILGLGVGGFLSIRMANRAAVTGFEGFAASVTGGGGLRVQKPVGELTIEDARRVAETIGLRPAEPVPVVEGTGELRTREGVLRPIRLVGIDLIGIQNVPGYANADDLLPRAGSDNEGSPDLWEVLREGRGAWLAPELAEELGASEGELLDGQFSGREHRLTVRGILPPNRFGVSVPPNLVIMDLPAAQRALGQTGLDHVEVLIDGSVENGEALCDALVADLTEAGEGQWRVETPQARSAAGEQMTAAFRLNLLVLSLIALVVALYLIALGMDAAVVRRRKEIGILRSLGLTPVHIRRLWAVDIGLLTFFGTLAGIALGAAAAQVVVRGVARTVNTLYLETTASSAALTEGDVLTALLIGIVGGAVAGWLPLKDAAATPPAQVMAAGRFVPGLGLLRNWRLGLAAVAVAAFCAFLPPATLPDGGSFPVGGYVAAFASLLGATILIATAIGPIASGLVPRLSHLPEVQHGLQRLRAASSRHRLGTAGLLVATGMALSMGIMTHSFERTLIRWLDVRFQADGFLFAPQSGGREYVPEEAISWFASQQEVDTVLPTSRFPVAFGGGTIQLEGAPYPEYLTRQQFLWLDEPRGTARIPPGADGSAIVSETFRYRFGLSTGDRVELETPDGRKQLWISGVKADYGSDRGLLQIGLDNLQAWYDLPGYTNATLYLNTDTELPLDTWQAQWPGLGLLSQAGLRETVLRVFNETFTVARGVQFLGLGVAFIGLALAMFTLIREDQASLRTLHALGLPRSRIARVLAAEAAGLAGIAGIGGLVLSLGLGALLVFVINRQSFGWTLQYELPWVNLLTQVLGIVVAGAATGALCGRFAGDLKLANRE